MAVEPEMKNKGVKLSLLFTLLIVKMKGMLKRYGVTMKVTLLAHDS